SSRADAAARPRREARGRVETVRDLRWPPSTRAPARSGARDSPALRGDPEGARARTSVCRCPRGKRRRRIFTATAGVRSCYGEHGERRGGNHGGTRTTPTGVVQLLDAVPGEGAGRTEGLRAIASSTNRDLGESGGLASETHGRARAEPGSL